MACLDHLGDRCSGDVLDRVGRRQPRTRVGEISAQHRRSLAGTSHSRAESARGGRRFGGHQVRDRDRRADRRPPGSPPTPPERCRTSGRPRPGRGGAQKNGRQEQLTLQAQRTERYTQAINQLGNSADAVALGGIYALEQLGHDYTSDEDDTSRVDGRRMVTEVLAAYVRHQTSRRSEHESAPGEPRQESIKAALDVLSRTGWHPADLRAVVLDRAELGGLKLSGADLEGAKLLAARMSGIFLDGANLSRADLTSAELHGATLKRANLEEAEMERVCLKGSSLREANLSVANLRNAALVRADLSGADLRKANLDGADLALANLRGARLAGSSLRGTNLSKADLTGAEIDMFDIDDAITAGTRGLPGPLPGTEPPPSIGDGPTEEAPPPPGK